jgi:hypothetical protein
MSGLKSQTRTFESQNAKRRAGRLTAPARRTHFVTDRKSPKLPISQRLTQKRCRPRRQAVLSCCRPDMGRQSWKFEGGSPSIPTHSCVQRAGCPNMAGIGFRPSTSFLSSPPSWPGLSSRSGLPDLDFSVLNSGKPEFGCHLRPSRCDPRASQALAKSDEKTRISLKQAALT